MPELTRDDPDRGDDTVAVSSRGSGAGTPRWVKVAGIVALVLVLLVVVLLLVGGGSHGPGRHVGGGTTPSDVSADPTPAGGDAGGHIPPAGGHE